MMRRFVSFVVLGSGRVLPRHGLAPALPLAAQRHTFFSSLRRRGGAAVEEETEEEIAAAIALEEEKKRYEEKNRAAAAPASGASPAASSQCNPQSASSAAAAPTTASSSPNTSAGSEAGGGGGRAAHGARRIHFDTSASTFSDIAAESTTDQLAAQVRHLTRELQHAKAIINELVPLVDREKHSVTLEKLGRNLQGGGGLFIAEDSAALLEGLKTPGARIILREGRFYLLDLFEPVTIRRTTVSIVGNGATIVGAIAMDGDATLDITDAFLFSPNGQSGRPQLQALPPAAAAASATDAATRGEALVRPEEEITSAEAGNRCANAKLLPLLSATNGSRLFVHNCTLVNGRDGVYLGVNAKAQIIGTRFRNCIRGVYEGVGCLANVAADCAFSGNYYHLVLLGPDKHARMTNTILPSAEGGRAGVRFAPRASAGELCPPGFRVISNIWQRRTRADVVLEQDPIYDTYAECWRDGAPVELTEEQSTANLSDPVY